MKEAAVAIRQFAVFAHFEGAAMTEAEGRRLAAQPGLYVQVVSRVDPVKVSATVTAPSMAKAIESLVREVNRVAPDALETNINAIEVSPRAPIGVVAVSEAS
jgi:hypothetical protein